MLVAGLAGLGMYLGAGPFRTRVTGVQAAVLALVAVLGGMFVAVSLPIDRMIARECGLVIDDHIAQVRIWSELCEHRLPARVSCTWPHGVDADTAMEHGNFPIEVSTAARRRWSAMDPASRDEFKTAVQASVDAEMRHAQDALTGLAFIFSFGLFDLLFVALAIFSAYKFGAAGPDRLAAAAKPVVAAAEPDAVAPHAGPLSRVPLTTDRPQTFRAHEPPLIIQRKNAAEPTPPASAGWRVVSDRTRNRAGNPCEQIADAPPSPDHARGRVGFRGGRFGGRLVISPTAGITPRPARVVASRPQP